MPINSAESKQRKPSHVTIHTSLPQRAFGIPIMEMFTSVTLRGKWRSDAADGGSLGVVQGQPAVICTEGHQQKDFLPSLRWVSQENLNQKRIHSIIQELTCSSKEMPSPITVRVNCMWLIIRRHLLVRCHNPWS